MMVKLIVLVSSSDGVIVLCTAIIVSSEQGEKSFKH